MNYLYVRIGVFLILTMLASFAVLYITAFVVYFITRSVGAALLIATVIWAIFMVKTRKRRLDIARHIM